jgi:hypothetical protein
MNSKLITFAVLNRGLAGASSEAITFSRPFLQLSSWASFSRAALYL